MAKSKFFRVAVEGATATDGREITAAWINDICDTYNAQTYGARVNMEHIRGFSADAPFNSYGDVLAVKKQTDDIEIAGKTEKRLALYAQIDPTPELVNITGKRQKNYTSIEVAPDFAKTGKAGLVGLAVTDSPASLGTEYLQFSANNPAVKAALDARKLDPANVFSAAQEFKLELEPDTSTGAIDLAGLFKDMRSFFTGAPAAQTTTVTAPAPADGASPAGGFTAEGLERAFTAFADKLKPSLDGLRTDLTKVSGDVATLQGKLDKTEDHSSQRRPNATGGGGEVQTDC